MSTTSEILVIGGSAAGLATALTLARSRRRVLVVDSGAPRNAPADGIHNYLGREGASPADLVRDGRREVEGYGAEVIDDQVAELTARPGGGFSWRTAGGVNGVAAVVVLATGVTDRLPAVPGLAERWGHSVIHCPYCHGWEVRDQPIGVLAAGPGSVHQALLARQLSDDVVYFAHTAPELDAEAAARLAARGIRIQEGEVTEVTGAGTGVERIHLAGGGAVPRDALFVASEMTPRDALARGLGAQVEELPGLGSWVTVDADGRTSVDGLWAVGNVVDPRAQVITSAAAGTRAAAAINMTLVDREVVQARRPSSGSGTRSGQEGAQ
ncbi:MAG: NAD(P)/FAD-dependent oxidoreductase [Microbacteriaceae bacterium]